MKKVALIFSFLSAFTCLRSQDLILNFDHNRSIPYDASIRHLENNLQYLKHCDSLLLVGHTDTTGTQSINEAFSRRRADWVYRYLLKNGVKIHTRLDWKGEGEVLDPSNDSLNRRVALYAYYTVLDFPKKQAQIFQIDNSRDTMIMGMENTAIVLPASSLLSDNPHGSDMYDVYLAEYYSLEDMMLNNLTTQTPTDLLATEGMIKLEVYQNGASASVDPYKPIGIGIPATDSSNDNLELFYGAADENRKVTWNDNASGGIPEYRGEVEVVPIGDDLPLPTSSVKFQGGGSRNLANYIKERIDYSLIERDSSEFPDAWVFVELDPLGNISNPIITPDMGTEFESEIKRILAEAPPCDTLSSGKYKDGAIAVIWIAYDVINKYLTRNVNSQSYSRSPSRPYDTTFVDLRFKVFSSIDLGWINYDYYAFKGKKRTDFSVEASGIGKEIHFLVFKKYRALMSGNLGRRDAGNDKSYVKYYSVPVDEEVYAIVIKNVGKKIFFSSKPAITSDRNCVVDDFEEISMEELGKKLSGISKAF